MNLIAIPDKLIKDAQMLRNRLQKGLIDTTELNRFLASVESYALPNVKNIKRRDRFTEKLDKLNNKTFKKS